jgi:hypothetical protein
MAVRWWWACEGGQIPASASSEHGPPSEQVRRATATPLMPPMVQWDPVFLKLIGGASALRIWWAWRGRVRCRHGTLLAANDELTRTSWARFGML